MIFFVISACGIAQIALAAFFLIADRGRSAVCLSLAALAGAVNAAMWSLCQTSGSAAHHWIVEISIGSWACAFAGVLVLEAVAAALQADIRAARALRFSLLAVSVAAVTASAVGFFISDPASAISSAAGAAVQGIAFLHVLFSAALTADLLASFRRKIAPVFQGAAALLFLTAAGGPLLAQAGWTFFFQAAMPLASAPLFAAYLALGGLLFFHLPLFDLSRRWTRVALVGVVATLLFFLLDAAFLLAWKNNEFVFDPASPGFWVAAALLGALVSTGPLVVTVLVRRSFMLSGYQTSGLAHELKSPVSIILNGLEFLRESDARHKTGRADYIQMLRNNAERLRVAIDSLRSIDAIQQGPLDLDRRLLALDDVLKNHVTRATPLAGQKGIALHVECPAALRVSADPEKLDQILFNLLSNAVKFSSHGAILVSASERARDILICVRDNGAGLDRREISRIFDRFYQGRAAGRGTGLGLAVAKGFVEAHGGRIWAESAGLGQGATLLFTLPRSDS